MTDDTNQQVPASEDAALEVLLKVAPIIREAGLEPKEVRSLCDYLISRFGVEPDFDMENLKKLKAAVTAQAAELTKLKELNAFKLVSKGLPQVKSATPVWVMSRIDGENLAMLPALWEPEKSGFTDADGTFVDVVSWCLGPRTNVDGAWSVPMYSKKAPVSLEDGQEEDEGVTEQVRDILKNAEAAAKQDEASTKESEPKQEGEPAVRRRRRGAEPAEEPAQEPAQESEPKQEGEPAVRRRRRGAEPAEEPAQEPAQESEPKQEEPAGRRRRRGAEPAEEPAQEPAQESEPKQEEPAAASPRRRSRSSADSEPNADSSEPQQTEGRLARARRARVSNAD